MNGLALASEIESFGKLTLSPFTELPDLEVPAVILTLLSPLRGKDLVEPGEIFLMVFPTL
jgi:hypothetical protein